MILVRVLTTDFSGIFESFLRYNVLSIRWDLKSWLFASIFPEEIYANRQKLVTINFQEGLSKNSVLKTYKINKD